jgi:RNA polymerase sigma-70 factor (ECF subfamily)
MLGSFQDAEDAVQDTLLAAWKGLDGFAGRASLRTWLYRIATNVCLTALDSRARRPLPTGLGAPSSDAADPLSSVDLPWLEPAPDALVGAADDPASVVAGRAGVRLALIAALLGHARPPARRRPGVPVLRR